MLTYAIRKTTLCVALTTAVSTQALAATEIPFWHSMEGELGKEVDSPADRFNQSHSDVKIVPVYKGNYEQSRRRASPLTAPARRRRSCRFTRWAPPP